jgi:hypothetical protein
VLSSGDNRVLFSTRLLALVILPFLLGAFTILYVFPMDTARLFAWPIKPTMMSMARDLLAVGGALLHHALPGVWGTVGEPARRTHSCHK